LCAVRALPAPHWQVLASVKRNTGVSCRGACLCIVPQGLRVVPNSGWARGTPLVPHCGAL
jgi:hypothetical protein